MFGLDEERIDYTKRSFTPGAKVTLFEMVGEPHMPYGLEGIVRFVDDIGQVHMQWENGSQLALHPEEDIFEFSAE